MMDNLTLRSNPVEGPRNGADGSMKAATFEYIRPTHIDEVVSELARAGTDARIIAGGQSLVPMMAMRLVRPELLVDINHVSELTGIGKNNDSVCVRAATRQADAGRSEIIARVVPMLAAAVPFIGHNQTRNRGTIGGSLAHGDPTAEVLLVAMALGATLDLRSEKGERSVNIKDFAVAPMETVMEEDECLVAARFQPAPTDLRVTAVVEEVAPRAGDYAILSVSAEIGLDLGGFCRHLRLGVSGATPVPFRPHMVEIALADSLLADDEVDDAVHLIDPVLDPESDVQASAAYRRRVAPGLLGRAIRTARDRAVVSLV